MSPLLTRVVPAAVAVLVAVACGQGASSDHLVVFAASSLSDAFVELAQTFEAEHPQLTVTLQLAGSQQLAGQLLDGARADVFASADEAQIRRVSDAGLLAAPPQVLARTDLVIAVEPGNPKRVRGLADLADEDVVTVLAAEEVPAGHYTRQTLAAAGVHVQPASLETDVRAVLSKVALGEADAAVVYRSDVVAVDDRVDAVPIPKEVNVVATYSIAPVVSGTNPAAGAQFLDFVASPEAKNVLVRFGFSSP